MGFQMSDISYILQNLSPQSLVIIDELGISVQISHPMQGSSFA